MMDVRRLTVCSIFDVDLDYFNLVGDPVQRFRELLAWAERPVGLFVEEHHAYRPSSPYIDRESLLRELCSQAGILYPEDSEDTGGEEEKDVRF